MEFGFYGYDKANAVAKSDEYPGIKTPADLYKALMNIWCRYSCAPRMRAEWSEDNPTLGQCSITAFLAQDIFGGKVYGTLTPSGDVHCFNVVNGVIFDLTSEQFKGKALDYNECCEQSREEHFSKEEKRLRYEYLRKCLKDQLRNN